MIEWVSLLTGARPDLSEADAHVLVHAALALINSLSRIHHLRSQPDLAARMTVLALAVLMSGTEPTGRPGPGNQQATPRR